MRDVRWLGALMLAACATTPEWTSAPVDETTRPVLLERLRNAAGEACLFVGDRCYIVREAGLRPEIRAYAVALANAIESLEPPPQDPRSTLGSPVIAVSWPGEAMKIDHVCIQSIHLGDETRIWVWSLVKPDLCATAEVRGTAATAETWQRLVSAAREQAVTAIGGPNTMLLDYGIDIRGLHDVDVAGLGGPSGR